MSKGSFYRWSAGAYSFRHSYAVNMPRQGVPISKFTGASGAQLYSEHAAISADNTAGQAGYPGSSKVVVISNGTLHNVPTHLEIRLSNLHFPDPYQDLSCDH